MTDRKLYVRAAEVPERNRTYYTPGKLYEFRPCDETLGAGYITNEKGDTDDFILTEHSKFQCTHLRGTSAVWQIVDADGNPVTGEADHV